MHFKGFLRARSGVGNAKTCSLFSWQKCGNLQDVNFCPKKGSLCLVTAIIAFSGKKQSGKSTIVNFLHGHEMKRHGFIKDFKISSDGQLIVNALYKNENDQE